MSRRASRGCGESIQCLCFSSGSKCKASTRPAAERVTFFACAKKGNQRNTPPVSRLPGILPSRCASGLRGSLSAHPCARNELARILRATLRAFLRPLAAPQGAPLGGILPQKPEPQPQPQPQHRSALPAPAARQQRSDAFSSMQCRDARLSRSGAPYAVPSIAAFAGSARRGAATDRRACEAVRATAGMPEVEQRRSSCRDVLSEQPR